MVSPSNSLSQESRNQPRYELIFDKNLESSFRWNDGIAGVMGPGRRAGIRQTGLVVVDVVGHGLE